MTISSVFSSSSYNQVDALPINSDETFSEVEIYDAFLNGNVECLKQGLLNGLIDPQTTLVNNLQLESMLHTYQAMHFPQLTYCNLKQLQSYFSSLEKAFSDPNVDDAFIAELSNDEENLQGIIAICKCMAHTAEIALKVLTDDLSPAEKEKTLYAMFYGLALGEEQFDNYVYKDSIDSITNKTLFECFFTMGEVELGKLVIEQANSQGADIQYDNSLLEDLETKLKLDLQVLIDDSSNISQQEGALKV